jgi:hypothetical protein
VATHSIGYYEKPTILIGVGVEIVLVPTPHSPGIGSCGYSKVH